MRNKKMTQIIVKENECYVCGGNKDITIHHTIPQHLKPKKNVLVPVCQKCHDKITSTDVVGLYAYMYKLEQTTAQLLKQVTTVKTIIENTVFVTVRKKDDKKK